MWPGENEQFLPAGVEERERERLERGRDEKEGGSDLIHKKFFIQTFKFTPAILSIDSSSSSSLKINITSKPAIITHEYTLKDNA